MKVSGATDQGCKRKNNEDYYFFDFDRRLFIVADGMGGHKAGERASQLAVETAESFLSKEKVEKAVNNPEKLKKTMIAAVAAANEAVFKEAMSSRKFRGMGCTLIIAISNGNLFHICHVGDTRAYMVSDEGIQLLTEDHTIVQDLINRGNITYEESKTHPLKHMLSRSIGNKPAVEASYKNIIAEADSYILLCSDGLNSMIDDDVIKNIILKNEETEEIKDSLIDSAKEAGGKDNITVIIIKIEEEDEIDSFRKEILFPEEDNYKTTRLVAPGGNVGNPWWKFWKFW